MMAEENELVSHPDTEPQITHPKKIAFLDNYLTYKNISKTAQYINVNRRTVFDWRKEDEVFSNALDILQSVRNEVKLEGYEAKIDEMIDDPTTPAVTRAILLMFVVKKHDPTYRDKVVEHRVSGDIIFKHNMPGEVIEGDGGDWLPVDTTRDTPNLTSVPVKKELTEGKDVEDLPFK